MACPNVRSWSQETWLSSFTPARCKPITFQLVAEKHAAAALHGLQDGCHACSRSHCFPFLRRHSCWSNASKCVLREILPGVFLSGHHRKVESLSHHQEWKVEEHCNDVHNLYKKYRHPIPAQDPEQILPAGNFQPDKCAVHAVKLAW